MDILAETLKRFEHQFRELPRPQTDEEARHHPNSPFMPLNDALDDARDDYVRRQMQDMRAIGEKAGDLWAERYEVMTALTTMIMTSKDERETKAAIGNMRTLFENAFAAHFDRYGDDE